MSETPSETPYAPPLSLPTENQKICQTCHSTLHKKAEICPKCGVRQRKPASKGTLLLLTFFLGGLGAHRFYIGSYFLGTVYLLLFWTGIPSIIALIEFIVFAFISSEKIEDGYDAHIWPVLIIVPIVIMFIIGIIAAVAIPAYTERLYRTRVAEAISLLIQLKTPTEEYFAAYNKFPPSLEVIGATDISGKYVAKLEINPEELYFQAIMGENSELSGKAIRLTYDPENLTWQCHSPKEMKIENKYLPSVCRTKD